MVVCMCGGLVILSVMIPTSRTFFRNNPDKNDQRRYSQMPRFALAGLTATDYPPYIEIGILRLQKHGAQQDRRYTSMRQAAGKTMKSSAENMISTECDAGCASSVHAQYELVDEFFSHHDHFLL
ncbi:hypothetical protein PR048_024249 [Dryococelus australis]|uniref:Uncharacterized protein n=1 Tax=Dryococelus australis TaxID=614101 RepID=A0ABQ9GN16_9NEOP|nr:hypothetical protein PR048_024249 [Dryococelus australis]